MRGARTVMPHVLTPLPQYSCKPTAWLLRDARTGSATTFVAVPPAACQVPLHRTLQYRTWFCTVPALRVTLDHHTTVIRLACGRSRIRRVYRIAGSYHLPVAGLYYLCPLLPFTVVLQRWQLLYSSLPPAERYRFGGILWMPATDTTDTFG